MLSRPAMFICEQTLRATHCIKRKWRSRFELPATVKQSLDVKVFVYPTQQLLPASSEFALLESRESS